MVKYGVLIEVPVCLTAHNWKPGDDEVQEVLQIHDLAFEIGMLALQKCGHPLISDGDYSFDKSHIDEGWEEDPEEDPEEDHSHTHTEPWLNPEFDSDDDLKLGGVL